jgi:hypothetical protein
MRPSPPSCGRNLAALSWRDSITPASAACEKRHISRSSGLGARVPPLLAMSELGHELTSLAATGLGRNVPQLDLPRTQTFGTAEAKTGISSRRRSQASFCEVSHGPPRGRRGKMPLRAGIHAS